MRFQVLLKKENVPGMSFFPFFETLIRWNFYI